MSENFNDRVRAFLHKNAGYLIVLLVSLAYIATAVLGIDESGKSVMRIIGDGAIAFMVGFAINLILGLQGIMNGERDEEFLATLAIHGETVYKITPYIEDLDEWCNKKNAENLKSQRTRILATEGLKYSDCFDNDGAVIIRENEESDSKNEAEERRAKCLQRAINLELTPLSAGELTSEGNKSTDPYDFGRSKEKYEKQTGKRELVTRILTALVFGYYSVSLLSDFSYVNLIWNFLQVTIFVITGTIKMYNSYLFITGEYRGRIVKKVNTLEMFYNDIKKKEQTENVNNEYRNGQEAYIQGT